MNQPEDDRPMTIRVHPDDNPDSPTARRVVKSGSIPFGLDHPWVQITGHSLVMYRSNAQVRTWVTQHWPMAVQAIHAARPCG